MNRGEQLLTILSEENSEVIQAITKAIRFGVFEGRDISETNLVRLRAEIKDVRALIEMVEHEFNIDLSSSPEDIVAKKAKVERYLIYSKECGTLA